jgi:hypothetical protein
LKIGVVPNWTMNIFSYFYKYVVPNGTAFRDKYLFLFLQIGSPNGTAFKDKLVLDKKNYPNMMENFFVL